MEIHTAGGPPESVLFRRNAQTQGGTRPPLRPSQVAAAPLREATDDIALSPGTPLAGPTRAGAQLTRETRERTETGYRLTQDFKTPDERTFTRIQDYTITPRGFRRDVVQQNPSGSTTRLEEVLDRQENGFFRRTQRFTDETGKTQAVIENDFIASDPFVLSEGRTIDPDGPAGTPPSPLHRAPRGTRLDITA